MEENLRPSIDDVLKTWLGQVGVWVTSNRGKEYKTVPRHTRYSQFLNLIETLKSCGYSEKEIKSGIVTAKVVDICWHEDTIHAMSANEFRGAKNKEKANWENALLEVFPAVKIVEYTGVRKTEAVQTGSNKTSSREFKEMSMDDIVNPKDRIKMDTTDINRAEVDEDFLKELNISEQDVDGKIHE